MTTCNRGELASVYCIRLLTFYKVYANNMSMNPQKPNPFAEELKPVDKLAEQQAWLEGREATPEQTAVAPELGDLAFRGQVDFDENGRPVVTYPGLPTGTNLAQTHNFQRVAPTAVTPDVHWGRV